MSRNNTGRCPNCGEKGSREQEDNGFKWAVCDTIGCPVMSYTREEVAE